eukprot:6176069-Pleurochrysis_carterae.AAC.3
MPQVADYRAMARASGMMCSGQSREDDERGDNTVWLFDSARVAREGGFPFAALRPSSDSAVEGVRDPTLFLSLLSLSVPQTKRLSLPMGLCQGLAPHALRLCGTCFRYRARVLGYDAREGKHKLVYDDREVESVDLSKETVHVFAQAEDERDFEEHVRVGVCCQCSAHGRLVSLMPALSAEEAAQLANDSAKSGADGAEAAAKEELLLVKESETRVSTSELREEGSVRDEGGSVRDEGGSVRDEGGSVRDEGEEDVGTRRRKRRGQAQYELPLRTKKKRCACTQSSPCVRVPARACMCVRERERKVVCACEEEEEG